MGVLLFRQCDPPDRDAARSWWEKAANAGDSQAIYYLGLLAAQSVPPDLAVAREWFEKAAEAGHTGAMMELGYMAARQEDPADPETARKWWEKAASTGEIEAMFNLGRLLAMQWDPPDLDAARSWWEKAAEVGHVGAMFSLGILFRAIVEPPDLPAARTWLEKAAAAGSEDAATYLDEFFRAGPVKVSDLLQRSGLGTGWYHVRDDGDCEGLDTEVVDALIGAGACAVRHSGMFQSTTMAIAFPGGCLYEMIGSYGFGGLPQGTWLFGPAAVRQVFRLLGYDQPKRRLSGEATVPTTSEVHTGWEEFAGQEQLEKIGLSLGALVWMRMPWLTYGRKANPDHFEPISLPIQWSRKNPPPDAGVNPMDPRDSDSMFWTAETTTVRDSTGTYLLRADGRMTRNASRH